MSDKGPVLCSPGSSQPGLKPKNSLEEGGGLLRIQAFLQETERDMGFSVEGAPVPLTAPLTQ